MATNPTWVAVFDDKRVINQSLKNEYGHSISYVVADDAFWNQNHFSNLWAIQYGTASSDDAIEHRDSTPHAAHNEVTHGNFNEFITRWDTAHLAQLQSDWDVNSVLDETPEQKINRLGAKPTSFSSPAV